MKRASRGGRLEKGGTRDSDSDGGALDAVDLPAAAAENIVFHIID